jgi:hypothetical protein
MLTRNVQFMPRQKRPVWKNKCQQITHYMLNRGWCRETGKFEVDYEIPPCGQVPSARGFVTLKRLVRL